jgi:hypothetical protein
MHYVTDASYAGGYKLRLRFDDDAVRVVDLTEYLDGPVFQPLKDPSFFKRFTLNQDIDTVVWPNGADFSPDFLYEIGKNIGEQATGADALTRVAQS